MNWKLLVPLPLAALAVASPLQLPKLRPTIPLLKESQCNYQMAMGIYLEAYAYRIEKPELAKRFLATAEEELDLCGNEAEILKSRMQNLRRALSP